MASCLVVASSLLSSPRPPKTSAQKPPLQPISSLSPLHSAKPKNSTNPTFLKAPFLLSDSCRIRFLARASLGETDASSDEPPPLVGEDSAAFDLETQNIVSWVYFTVILGVVLYVLDVVWIDNSTGFGKVFIDAVSSLSDSQEVYFINHRYDGLQLWQFQNAPGFHQLVYFINHRYDGLQLWQFQNAPGFHQLVWLSNFISFFFLYPSTFNLLEVAAVDKPKMHLWQTGIMRITRHPQMVGQVIWCLAHTIWIGNSVAIATSIGLIGHHLFGVWNGDKRLAMQHGEAFEVVKKRTSIIPFAAILDGRQKLPKDYYKEFIRLPYFTITALTLGAYFLHPVMQAASFRLHW
ncbi:hypothetical protein CRYUN_Cryun35bG0077500 [Craigia yunnanensis]